MNQQEIKPEPGKKGKGSKFPSPARRIGYIFVIIIMIIILYLVRNYDKWGFYFLTDDFRKCLFYIELSIFATIAANILFIFYDNRWFKHMVQAATDIAGGLSLIMIYVIYPLNIDGGAWDKWIKIGLLVLFCLTVISIIVNLIKGIRYLVSEPERV
jgi:hypothetical protein